MKQLSLTFDPPLSPVAPALTNDVLIQEIKELLDLAPDVNNDTILLAIHALKAIVTAAPQSSDKEFRSLRAGDVD